MAIVDRYCMVLLEIIHALLIRCTAPLASGANEIHLTLGQNDALPICILGLLARLCANVLSSITRRRDRSRIIYWRMRALYLSTIVHELLADSSHILIHFVTSTLWITVSIWNIDTEILQNWFFLCQIGLVHWVMALWPVPESTFDNKFLGVFLVELVLGVTTLIIVFVYFNDRFLLVVRDMRWNLHF